MNKMSFRKLTSLAIIILMLISLINVSTAQALTGRFTRVSPDYEHKTVEFVVKANDNAFAYLAGDFNGWGGAVGNEKYKLTWVQLDSNDGDSWAMRVILPIADLGLENQPKIEFKYVLIPNANDVHDPNKWQWVGESGFDGPNISFTWQPPVTPEPNPEPKPEPKPEPEPNPEPKPEPKPAVTMLLMTSSSIVNSKLPVDLLAVKTDAWAQKEIVADASFAIEPPVPGATIINNQLIVSDQLAPDTEIVIHAQKANEVSNSIKIKVQTPARQGVLTHYFRRDNDYQYFNYWSYAPGLDGIRVDFSEELTTLGKAAYLTRENVIVRQSLAGNDFTYQTPTYQIPQNIKNAYIIDGETKVFTSLKTAVLAMNDQIKTALMDSESAVFADLTADPKPGEEFRLLVDGVVEPEVTATISGRHISFDTSNLSFQTNQLLEVQGVHQFKNPKPVIMRRILDSKYYDGQDLGITFAGTATVNAKLWAPTAVSVELVTYETAMQAQTQPTNTYNMHMDASTGVYEAALNYNQIYDQYYLYKLTFKERDENGLITTRTTYAVDPYAVAVGLNGSKGYCLDIEKDPETKPAGFENDQKPSFVNPEDAIVYEMHIRDFTIDANWGGNAQNAGKYLGVIEENTSYTAAGTTVKTGLDHLKELGITHVHLLPTYDMASVDESKSNERNWGYDPLNYNVPEGSYSGNASDPKTRIKEYRQMVMGLHRAGIRVVLDQVYNHMYTVDNMNKIVPNYYFRSWDNGQLSDGAGCGNEVATERPMVRKFIVDSNCHWVKNYKVDGLRFDLMALIDNETMRAIKTQTTRLEPSIIIYGEPWKAADTPLAEAEQTGKNKGIAAFNDDFRNAVRGDNSPSLGYISGARPELTGAVQYGIKGSPNTVNDPELIVNYVEAHDNYTIWDQVITGENLASKGYRPADLKAPILKNWQVKKALLANAFVLTSQGIPFFQGGSEILRTKNGDHNSYKSDDETNDIDWADKAIYQDVFKYYQGLIALRKNHSAFRMTTNAQISEHQDVYRLLNDDDLILQHLKNHANNDPWQDILVIYNSSINDKTITWLPKSGSGTYKVVADGDGVYFDQDAGLHRVIRQTQDQTANVNFVIPSSTLMILYDDGQNTPTADLQWDYLFADQSAIYVDNLEPDIQDPVKVRFRAKANNVTAAVLHYYDSNNSAAGDQTQAMHKITDSSFYTDYNFDADLVEFWEGELPAGPGVRYYNFEVIHEQNNQRSQAFISGGKGENGRGITKNAPRINPADPNSGIDYGFSIVAGYRTPQWAKESIFYQLMVDRFRDGDLTNNRTVFDISQLGNPSEISAWNDPVVNGEETDHIWNNQFFGGDLIGVSEAITYLKDVLGVNALYLMPIFQSGSDHKYDTDDYKFVDRNYGGNKALVNLTEELHNRDMHLILDGVFNHTSTDNEWFRDPNKRRKFYFEGDFLDNGNPPAHVDYYPWHGFTNLAKLNYAANEVKTAIYGPENSVNSQYLNAPFNIDGWRLDAAEDLNTQARDHDNSKDPNKNQVTQTDAEQRLANLGIWRGFRSAVNSLNKNAYLLGEYWGDQNQWFDGSAWSGKMNYGGFMLPFIENSSQNNWLGNQSLDNKGQVGVAGITGYTREYFKRIPYQAVLNSTNSISTHDKPRFLNREYVGAGNSQMMELAVTLQMTYPGVPMIYYGDEIGAIGTKNGNDPYNRQTFNWDPQSWNQDMLATHRKLIAARKQLKSAFVYGAFEELAASEADKYVAYARYKGREIALVVLNNSGQTGSQNLNLRNLERYGLKDGDVLVDVLSGTKVKVANLALQLEVKNMHAAVYVPESKVPTLPTLAALNLPDKSDPRTKLPDPVNVTYADKEDAIEISWQPYNAAGTKEIFVGIYNQDNKLISDLKVAADQTSARLPKQNLSADITNCKTLVKALADRQIRDNIVNDIYADSNFVQAKPQTTGTHQQPNVNESIWQGYSITLKTVPELNVYVELSDTVKTDPEAYIEITAPNGNSQNLKVADYLGQEFMLAGKKCHRFNIPIAPEKIGDYIEVQLHYKDQGQDKRSSQKRLLPQINLMTLIRNSQFLYDKQTQKAAIALLNYAASRQTLLNYNETDLANKELDPNLKNPGTVNNSDFAAFKSKVKGQLSGLTYVKSEIDLDQLGAIRHYFKLDNQAELNNYSFQLQLGNDHKDLTAIDLGALAAPEYNCYVDIKPINAKNLAYLYKLKVSKGSANLNIDYAVLSRGAVSLADNGADPVIIAMFKNLYSYYQAAKAYADSMTGRVIRY